MQKQTSIYIPKPCHEDWNKMTPTQQGKFCGSCNKQVVDFSLMSDNQILNLLSNQSGKLCGRFDAEQLQRPLIETKIKKKKSWWMALTMPLLFLFDRSEGQSSKRLTGDTIYNVLPSNKNVSKILSQKIPVCEPEKIMVGKIAYQPNEQITIKGKVVDENNQPLSYASVIQKGTIYGAATDSLGNFSIKINSDNILTLVVSYVSYETIEKTINQKEFNVNILMKLKPATAGEVVVVGYAVKAVTGRLGGLSVCRKITTFQKIDTSVRKMLNIFAFKIYPNPLIKGSLIYLEIKSAGEYQLQLLNNQSALIMSEELNVDSKKSTTPIQLPSNIAAGMYYLRLIDERKKKSYTEKIIIQ